MRFRETKMGFYHQGKIHSMNSTLEFLRFPLLGWIDRFRLGLTVLYAQFVRDWQQLEGISVEDWLIRWSGRRTFENIWRPMLRAKFDGPLLLTSGHAWYV
jgi:protoporphyrinogen oxidase